MKALKSSMISEVSADGRMIGVLMGAKQTVEYVKVTCFAKSRHRVFKLVKNHASTVVRNGNDCMNIQHGRTTKFLELYDRLDRSGSKPVNS